MSSVKDYGLGFRPTFQDIKGIKDAIADLEDAPILALTATANLNTQVNNIFK
jgi:superfamily II DNA helicase RecQ